MNSFAQLAVKIFADGADRAGMLDMYAKPHIQGLTTNPTLMRKAGIADYRAFAREVLSEIKDKPVAFEVLADDMAGMGRQALEIAGWADNVYVKIPVTTTRRESCCALVKQLADCQVKLNVTAVMTLEQVRGIAAALNPATASMVSVFAGRIADTGIDPLPLMEKALEVLAANARAELVWASTREMLNIFQADSIGCHIITATKDILDKLPLVGYDLNDYSLDTVRMFYDDALCAGFTL